MDDYRCFETKTEPKWYVMYTALTMLATAVAAAIALWFFTKIPEPTVYVLGMALIVFGIMVWILSKRPPVRLHFEGSRLYIQDSNGQNFQVYNVPVDNFVLKQSSLEKKTDVGRLQIKNTAFYFYGVKDFENMKRYIRENFH